MSVWIRDATGRLVRIAADTTFPGTGQVAEAVVGGFWDSWFPTIAAGAAAAGSALLGLGDSEVGDPDPDPEPCCEDEMPSGDRTDVAPYGITSDPWKVPPPGFRYKSWIRGRHPSQCATEECVDFFERGPRRRRKKKFGSGSRYRKGVCVVLDKAGFPVL